MNRETIRYEDNAEYRTGLEGWVSRKTGQYWGKDEHMARYDGANDFPCECGARITGGGRTHCDECRRKHQAERWAKLAKAEWDGETPLVEWDNDKFYFDVDSVIERLSECIADGGDPESFRLVICEKRSPPHFDMNDFLCDHLCEDDSVQSFGIDSIVNEWIGSHVGTVWEASNKAITDEQLASFIEQARADLASEPS